MSKPPFNIAKFIEEKVQKILKNNNLDINFKVKVDKNGNYYSDSLMKFLKKK